jgi:hypothetical protein
VDRAAKTGAYQVLHAYSGPAVQNVTGDVQDPGERAQTTRLSGKRVGSAVDEQQYRRPAVSPGRFRERSVTYKENLLPMYRGRG